jgi:8-amino-7-oxononanoate synthase
MGAHILEQRAAQLAQSGLERRLRTVSSAIGPHVETPEGRKLLFCSNDYLGLAGDAALRRLLANAAVELGAGASGSRLVCGNTEAHEALEAELADFLGEGAAVLFPSGYQANLGALSALTQPGDVIFSDELCHASIIDGCRLSRARVCVFPHRDIDALESAMAESKESGLRLVVTDAVFSMDGDLAPVRELHHVCERHGGLLYVDEAHALGILGPKGAGLCADQGLMPGSILRMGTLGKSLGLSGAFIACAENVARLLRSRARSQMYSTAMPPALIEAARGALRLVSLADDRRAALERNIEEWKRLAAQVNMALVPSTTPIQPVIIGSDSATMEVSERLWRQGIFVQGIRPPTVPPGTSRLRITVTAAHKSEHLEQLAEALAQSLPRE